MAWLKMAEPAELSHFEPSQANKSAYDQNGLSLAHELAPAWLSQSMDLIGQSARFGQVPGSAR